MSNEHQHMHYTGLTTDEVLRSREQYGSNVLTPPEKTTLWDRFRETCCHWISIAMIILSIGSVALAAFLLSGLLVNAWVMPVIVAIAAILIILVGFFGGYKDPLFKILITAFVMSIGISIYEFESGRVGYTAFFEPIGIIVALLLATGVAFFLERKNEKTFQSLNDVNDDTLVKVVRNNNVTQVPRRDIVVGDIVILDTGEEIPADCELLKSFNLIVNESSLTGEPQTHKAVSGLDDTESTYPSNNILKGTIVVEGYCTARVLRVGDATECGKVFVAAQVEEGDKTPLSEKLDRLAKLITTTSYLIAVFVIIGRIIVYFLSGDASFADAGGWLDFITYILQTVMIAVTLIVVAVPEGLPMSVTLSLAFSMRKLMKENTLPRTMHSCETMGAASVICTDKTGTLTQNQMQVADVQLEDIPDNLLAEMIAVNTTAHLDSSTRPIGNPTEGALLLWLNNKGTNYLPIRENTAILDRLPFSTENKYMATIAGSAVLNQKVLFVKGAPEIILAHSSLTEERRRHYTEILANYQHKAMRTLALAYMPLDEETKVFDDGKLAVSNLTFAGVFAISDPIRTDVTGAIQSCLDAGIQVKIVTGDTSGTAVEIGRQIGLWKDTDSSENIMTGTEFASMSDSELAERIVDIKILSRARPNDKERLVRLLKAQGLVVAVTGDGTNDAPALNMADVGLSMGDGTAVAKEASDMTIQDNSFSTIANAVMWGRSLYKNIQRFIMYQMTINVVACLIVLIGAFTGTHSPLTVTQMLWVNLIMDTFAAIALASLPPSKTVMKDTPRKVSDSVLNKAMVKNICWVGGLFTLILLVVLIYFQCNEIHSLSDISLSFGKYNANGLSDYELSLFFTIFVMLQFWNMFNAKAFMTGHSAFTRIRECRGFILIAIVIFVGQIAIVNLGGDMFNVRPIHIADWLVIIFSTSLVLIVGELWRFFHR